MVCYIQKYVIILAGIFPLTSPPTKILGGCVPGGVDASVSQNDTGQRQESTSMILPTLGSRTAKERNRTCRVEVIRLLRNAGVCLRGCSRTVFGACIMSFSIISLVALGRYRGKESVPIELAQCWFLAWAGHFQRLIYIFQIKYTETVLSNISQKLL